MEIDPKTELFVNTAIEKKELFKNISEKLVGFEKLQLSIEDSDEWPLQGTDPDDFLGYRYHIWITSGIETTDQEYIETIGQLMQLLASDQMRVVAACDFEDKLPGKGKLNTKP